MRKIKLYIAISLNGKIAKPDGSVEWLEVIPKPDDSDYGYAEFYDSVDCTLQGHNTYKQIKSWGREFPYKGKKNYVLTADTSLDHDKDVTFISSNHIEFIHNLKEEPGRDIWLIGGGLTNATLLDAKLVDELHVFVMPVILEEGIGIFENLSRDKSLILSSSKSYSTGVIEMIYHF